TPASSGSERGADGGGAVLDQGRRAFPVRERREERGVDLGALSERIAGEKSDAPGNGAVGDRFVSKQELHGRVRRVVLAALRFEVALRDFDFTLDGFALCTVDFGFAGPRLSDPRFAGPRPCTTRSRPRPRLPIAVATRPGISEGIRATGTPARTKRSIFSCAVPAPPETM